MNKSLAVAEKSDALVQSKADEIRGTLMSQRVHEKLFQGLPSHLNAQSIVASVCSAFYDNPELMKCTMPSICASIREAATCGWHVGGFLANCYLVPYKNNKTGTTECQLIPGYKGLIDLCRRSGEVKHIVFEKAHLKDSFDPITCTHKPYAGSDRGAVSYYYVKFYLTNGGCQSKAMSVEQIKAHRDKYAKGVKRSDSPWVQHFETMAWKTIVRWLVARGLVPLSLERVEHRVMDRVVKREEVDDVDDTAVADAVALIEESTEADGTDLTAQAVDEDTKAVFDKDGLPV